MKLKLILTTVIVGTAASLLGGAAPASGAPFLYVTNADSGNVSQYNAAGGALTPLAPATVSTVNNPLGVAVSPDGQNAYVTTSELYGTPAIEAALLHYLVGTSGSLALESSTPPTPNDSPGLLALSPDGRSLYIVVPSGAGSLLQYTVQAEGSLTPKSPLTVPTAPIPQNLAVSPDSRSVYVVNSVSGLSTVSQYTAAADGTLSPKTPPTVPTGSTPTAEPFGIVVSPDGKSVYVVDAEALFNLDGSVFQYSVGPDGTLSPKSPPKVPAARHPFDVAVSPDGESVYVTDAVGGRVLQYSVGPDGGLTPKSPPTVGAGTAPLGIAIHPNGQSVYVANASDGTISQYSVGAAGALSPKSPATVTAGDGPLEIAVTPLGLSSKDQCKDGGWRNFPQFKNQGQCIAFVNHGP
jgi:DNA-binding beta-propeller fold protein YncE